MSKAKKRGRRAMFYVFYDKRDFVKFCGTAEELVTEGKFSSINAVRSSARHSNERRPNSVIKVPLPKTSQRRVVIGETKRNQELYTF